MGCEYICDGCGKRAKAIAFPGGWFAPGSWYSRRDEQGIQDACSRECINNVAAASGKTSLVLPI